MPLNYSCLPDFLDDPQFIQWVKQPDDELQAFWETWQQAHPDKRELLEEARQLVLMLHFDPPKSVPTEQVPAEQQEVKGRLWQELGLEKDHIPQVKAIPEIAATPQSKVVQPNWYSRIAAGLTGLLLIGTALFWFYRQEPAVKYQTAYGEKRTLILPDQSVVVLNASSTLHYSPDWQADQPREVWITGEAFFAVRKQIHPETGKRSSFTVHTASADVQVLGTEFNVSNRRGKVQVVLKEGKVHLDVRNPQAPDVQMQPGDLVEVMAKNDRVTTRKVTPENYAAWRHGKWIFDQTPLPEIATMIEDYYGKKVQLSGSALTQKKFTGAVPVGQLDVLLTVLAESFNLEVTKLPNQIRLEARL